jgi:hypothetical protein
MPRLIPCILLAGGAIASIATSQVPPGWGIGTNQALDPAVIDDTTPTVRYQVHVELHGAEPITGLDGMVETDVSFAARDGSTPSGSIELSSLTNDVPPATINYGDVDPTTARERGISASLDAWLACTSDPCSEDFELVVHRDPGANLPALDIGGTVYASAGGTDKVQPPNTSVVLTVTREP